ncbi:MAG TPA: signal peptidase I [Actinomycetes bacterium]|nr:signal peptidase I [Actinomycetes bacterium]
MAKGAHARPRGSGTPEPESGGAGQAGAVGPTSGAGLASGADPTAGTDRTGRADRSSRAAQANGAGSAGGADRISGAAHRPRRIPVWWDGSVPPHAAGTAHLYDGIPQYDGLEDEERRDDVQRPGGPGYDRQPGHGEPVERYRAKPGETRRPDDGEDNGHPGPLLRGGYHDDPRTAAEPRSGAEPPDKPAGARMIGRRRRAERKPGSLWRELPILVGIAIILALLIKTFLVQAFYIPSDSMENTLLRGDRVLVNKLGSYFSNPDRGQVVVFRDPGGWLSTGNAGQPHNPIIRGIKKTLVFIGLLPSDSQQDLIKRVIGVPGDRVACCDDQGRVTVNGEPLDEPYVFPGNPPSDTTFDVVVPPDRLWVMGDHRSVSADSRVHMGEPGEGTIPMDNVVGRAFVVVWPLSRIGGLRVPETFHGDRLDQARSEPQALTTVLQSASAVPPLIWGFAAAVPIVAIRRRRRQRPRG